MVTLFCFKAHKEALFWSKILAISSMALALLNLAALQELSNFSVAIIHVVVQ